MDAGQRQTLEDFVRQTLSADLDELHQELDRLRQELRVVKGVAGMGERMPRAQRRQAVAEMREQGYSASLIARALGVHRQTVLADSRGLPPQTTSVDVHGVVREYHRNGR